MLSQNIPVRRPALDFEREIPRFYLEDNPLKTHFFNAINLAFPDGERFFVRSVHDHLADIEDPALRADVRAFCGQEGQHANQHERFFEVLRRQGYEVDSMVGRVRRIARWSNEHLPRGLRLSMTAGAEHYTATVAGLALDHGMLDDCDSTMRELIEWHAIEEIEHKHVAFDVLRLAHPWNYPLRVAGFAIATLVALVLSYGGTRAFMMQDARARRITQADYITARGKLRGRKLQRFRRALQWQLLAYLKPGFHPNQHDDAALLERIRPLVDSRLVSA